MRASSLVFLPIVLWSCEAEEPEEKEPPPGQLSITSPEAGSFNRVGTVKVKGVAAGVSGLTVNGVAGEPRAGNYTIDLELPRGVTVIEATAVDATDHQLYVRSGVLAGEWEAAEGALQDAMYLRVNEGGLRRIEEIAEASFDSSLINDSLAGMNPVYEDSYEVLGWDALTISANVDSVTFDQPEFSFDPESEKLELTVVLPNVYVDIYAWGEAISFDFDSDVSMQASEAVLTAELTIDAANGKLDVDVWNTTVELRDFSYDTSLLPGSVEDYILVDTIRSTIEEMLVEQINTMVPPLLDETLSGLDPSFSTELMGLSVDLEFSFAAAAIDNDGIALAMDMDVAIPPNGLHSAPGFLGADLGTPDVDTESDVAGAVSDDLLNRMLYEAWAGGLLDMTLSTDDGSLDPLLLLPLKASTGSIKVEPMLPPVIVEVDGGLQAQLGEVVVTVETPGGALGDHLTLSVNAFAPVEVLVSDGELVLALGTPEVIMMVRENAMNTGNEEMTNLVEKALPIDLLFSLLGDFSFPLPSLYGISIDDGEAKRDESGVYTGLEISLQ